jgi:hypothetical protein
MSGRGVKLRLLGDVMMVGLEKPVRCDTFLDLNKDEILLPRLDGDECSDALSAVISGPGANSQGVTSSTGPVFAVVGIPIRIRLRLDIEGDTSPVLCVSPVLVVARLAEVLRGLGAG